MSRVLPYNAKQWEIPLLLGGRKTVTRRLVKLPKYIQEQENGLYTLFAEGTCYENQNFEQIIDYLKKPYQPGDILYVREKWCENPNYKEYYYAAKRRDGAGAPYGLKWHPSIHMPKEAARIWLKVTDVRVERLQDITEEQAIKEGLYKGWQIPSLPKSSAAMTARQAFMWVWDDTQKNHSDVYGWLKNPWVWVIKFKRCEKPKDV